MKKKTKVLLVQPYEDNFFKKDLSILRKHFKVRKLEFSMYKKGKKTRLNLLFGVLWADVTFSWFADRHAYWAVKLSRLLGKKSLVIVGGYEVANLPEISYGLLRNISSTKKVRYALDNADKVLTVDEFLRKEAIKNLGITGGNIETVPTGYDTEFFKPKGNKEGSILTVGECDTWSRAKVKGLDLFMEVARLMPNAQFIVVGTSNEALEKLERIAPKNVEIIKPVPVEKLLGYYQKASVYCQLSMREGLPNSICEAMLCECVPVGTNCGGIPTAIGDAGYYVPRGNPEAAAEAIKKALASDKGKEARERIKNNFTLDKREKRLVEIINQLAK